LKTGALLVDTLPLTYRGGLIPRADQYHDLLRAPQLSG
jgi:hypothetical protein